MRAKIAWEVDPHTYVTPEALVSLVGQHAPVKMGGDRVGTAQVTSASVDDGVLLLAITLTSKEPAMDCAHDFPPTPDDQDSTCSRCSLKHSQWAARFIEAAPEVSL